MSFNLMVKYATFISSIAILVTFYMNHEIFEIETWLKSSQNRQLLVLNGLLALEVNNIDTKINKPKVAVGYGACLDLFVNATDLLKSHSLPGEPEHYDEIQSTETFLKNFAYYFKHGAAAERFMPDSELFNNWVQEASKIPTARWALGGNAPVMASRFEKEGCDVLLAAKMTDKLKANLNKDIQVTSGNANGQDDVHLIMEYATGDVWSELKSPRANRYIFHNDQNNPTVNSLEEFGTMMKTFKPDLVIVSGLQMMDNYPFQQGVREKRLRAIKGQMVEQGKDSRMHFEMASFVEELLVKSLMEYVIPYSDSLGMNEQELVNLHNLYLYGKVAHVADFNPRVATVLDQMRILYKMIRNTSKSVTDSKKVTRIHVHTLAYQAIFTEVKSNWKRSDAAAAKASLTANRHVCGSETIDVNKAKLILDNSFALSTKQGSQRIHFKDDEPVSCWNEQIALQNDEYSDVQICVAPVLVCTEVKQTAGCGDNISSAGLVLQI